jgi:hypothetical protein
MDDGINSEVENRLMIEYVEESVHNGERCSVSDFMLYAVNAHDDMRNEVESEMLEVEEFVLEQ